MLACRSVRTYHPKLVRALGLIETRTRRSQKLAPINCLFCSCVWAQFLTRSGGLWPRGYHMFVSFHTCIQARCCQLCRLDLSRENGWGTRSETRGWLVNKKLCTQIWPWRQASFEAQYQASVRCHTFLQTQCERFRIPYIENHGLELGFLEHNSPSGKDRFYVIYHLRNLRYGAYMHDKSTGSLSCGRPAMNRRRGRTHRLKSKVNVRAQQVGFKRQLHLPLRISSNLPALTLDLRVPLF